MGISKWFGATPWVFAILISISSLSAEARKIRAPTPTSTSTLVPTGTAIAISALNSSISSNPLTAGQTQSIVVTLGSATSVQNLIVDLRIYNSSNVMIARKPFDGVSIGAGATATFQFDYQSSASLPVGTYNVQVGVWDTNWATYLYETRNSFSVISGSSTTSPVPINISTVNSSISSNPLTAGQTQSAIVTLASATSMQNLIVDLRIYNSSNVMIARKPFDGVSIGAGATATFRFDYQSSSSLPVGTYNVQVGVWDTNWKTYLYEIRNSFSVVSGGSTAPTPVPQPTPDPGTSLAANIPLDCNENALAGAGSYLVQNNQWGKDGVYGGFSQCTGIGRIAGDGSVSARWTWSWPDGPSEIKGYPAIIYGQKPGYATTPNSNLPKRLDMINTATSSWSTKSNYTGKGQLTFDLWLTSDGGQYSRFMDTPLTHEIMVAVEPYNAYGLDRNPAWYIEEVVIGGIRYKVYKADNFGLPGRQWRFLVFQMLTPMVTGTLDFKPLFTYLKSKGFISGYEYLSSIEFGTEIQYGQGEVQVNSFKATTY